jgi:hypothetical protein
MCNKKIQVIAPKIQAINLKMHKQGTQASYVNSHNSLQKE